MPIFEALLLSFYSMAHVSFRDSKLTRLLKNALGGNSKTAIICTITPAAIEESDSTLKVSSNNLLYNF